MMTMMHDDHDDHDEEAHNEFVAHYSFNCENIKEIDRISFPYFTNFPNSGELEVQFVSEKRFYGFRSGRR